MVYDIMHTLDGLFDALYIVKMFDVIWIMFDVILPHPASCIGELTLLLVLRSPYRGY